MGALTLGIASMALGGYSAYSQARGQRRAARAAQAEAESSAEFQELQAEDALERGREEESRHRFGVRRFAGSQRAALAGQGIDISSGSAADIQEETAVLGELDTLTIRNNAAREAWGYRTQAELTRQFGANAAENLRNQARGTLLTGGAQLFGSAYGFASSRLRVPVTPRPSGKPTVGLTPTAYPPSPIPLARPRPRPWGS
jgi:hypothetical protein